jgi:hypothetical protein
MRFSKFAQRLRDPLDGELGFRRSDAGDEGAGYVENLSLTIS